MSIVRRGTLTSLLCVLCVLSGPISLSAQNVSPSQPARREPPSTLRAPTRLDIVRGEYGRYRANNDLLHYELEVRVDPAKKAIGGTSLMMADHEYRVPAHLDISALCPLCPRWP